MYTLENEKLTINQIFVTVNDDLSIHNMTRWEPLENNVAHL